MKLINEWNVISNIQENNISSTYKETHLQARFLLTGLLFQGVVHQDTFQVQELALLGNHFALKGVLEGMYSGVE